MSARTVDSGSMASIAAAQTIAPGGTFESFRAFELVQDATDRERRGLALQLLGEGAGGALVVTDLQFALEQETFHGQQGRAQQRIVVRLGDHGDALKLAAGVHLRVPVWIAGKLACRMLSGKVAVPGCVCRPACLDTGKNAST